MSLVKPIINSIVAFDATIGTTITFTANGGDQVAKNEIKVVTNDALETVVYQHTVTSYSLSHTIPANILTNGTYYKVAIRTFDAINNSSAWSNYQPFYCYTTPVLTLNIENNQVIRTQNYSVVLNYRQLQNEKLDYAIIQLYDNNGNLADTSGYMYNTNIPPLAFEYTLIGLHNHTQYTINATIVTVEGTTVETGQILFHTNYDTIIVDETLTATLDSCNGYVNLHSSTVTNLVGVANPDPPTYINNNKVDLISAVADMDIDLSSTVTWHGELEIPTDFLFRIWFYPARQPFKIAEFKDDDNTEYLTITFNRSSTEDYLSFRTASGTVIDHSLGTVCNGNTKVFLWMKVVENVWTIQTDILETRTTSLVWDDTSSNNIKYNVDSDVAWGSEPIGTFVTTTSVYQALSAPLTYLRIANGIFDELNITTDTSLSYTTVIPAYDDNTILSVSFSGNLNNNAPYYTRLILKRRDESLLNWINLSELIVQPNVPNYINFNDSFIPTGVEQTYALVTYVNEVESEYYTVYITPIWGKVFISDKDTRFALEAAVIYSNGSQNVQNGVLMPIGAKYPIVIQNGEGNYKSGSVQFKVLGYQYDIDKRLDRVSITKQKNDMLAFLTNGKAKCITDYNGNIIICKVINSPQVSYDGNWGNGIATISFDWVEQAQYNNYEEMLGLGLFDQIGA